MKMLIGLLLAGIHILAIGDDLLGKSDDELIDMIHSGHPERGCLFWRHEARYFHTLFPEDSILPEAIRNDRIRKAIGLDGEQKEPSTSVNYILKKMMFDMALAKGSPADTEVTVYAQCLKYEREYTYSMRAGGQDPNPRLRSADSEQ